LFFGGRGNWGGFSSVEVVGLGVFGMGIVASKKELRQWGHMYYYYAVVINCILWLIYTFMALSKKHHYLPVFYLKGFTNLNGKFSIYNYAKAKIEHKEFSPSMYFYDNRNLIELNGTKDDYPETMYSVMDQRHSILIDNIRSQDDIPKLSLEDMLLLQEFVSSIFWRLPSTDSYFTQQYKDNPEFTKKLKIVNESTGEVDNEVTKNTINHIAFIKGIKPFMPIILKRDNNTDLENWQFIYDPLGNFTCSDEPILFRNEKPKDIYDSEFIFPLSKNLLLLRTFKKINREELPAPVMALIQLLLFVQGSLYCCSANRDVLQRVKTESSNLRVTKENLFSILEDPEWLQSLHQQWLDKRK
jgi:hypothetical protein